jgi:hypothetical protein
MIEGIAKMNFEAKHTLSYGRKKDEVLQHKRKRGKH